MPEKPTTPEEMIENTTERTLSDASLIGRGAEYVVDSGSLGSPRLQVTSEQIEGIRKLMGAELREKHLESLRPEDRIVFLIREFFDQYPHMFHGPYVKELGVKLRPDSILISDVRNFKEDDGSRWEELAGTLEREGAVRVDLKLDDSDILDGRHGFTAFPRSSSIVYVISSSRAVRITKIEGEKARFQDEFEGSISTNFVYKVELLEDTEDSPLASEAIVDAQAALRKQSLRFKNYRADHRSRVYLSNLLGQIDKLTGAPPS